MDYPAAILEKENTITDGARLEEICQTFYVAESRQDALSVLHRFNDPVLTNNLFVLVYLRDKSPVFSKTIQ